MPHSTAIPFIPSRAGSQADHKEHREKKKSSSAKPSPVSSPAPPPTKRASYDDVEDKASILSRSTQTSTTLHTEDALANIAGHRVRHARCAPEFLEAIAFRDDNQVKIITGLEASTFFVKYLGEHDNDDANLRSTRRHTEKSRAIVFAVTVYEHGRKCVDYYMTWRKNHGNTLQEHTITELDEEFRRVARKIDKDYKTFRRAGSVASASSTSSQRKSSKRDRSRSPAAAKKSRPEALVVLPAEEEKPVLVMEVLPDPPASATDSVISLPYLNMVRGVPRGNRVPLRVVNPDRFSTYSELEPPIAIPVVSAQMAKPAADDSSPLVIAITPADPLTPIAAAADPEPSGLAPIMKSSASIRSTGTRSSKWSQSSNSSPAESPNQKEDAKLPSVEKSSIKFLIVLLGDKLEKEGLSWHGLTRQTSTRSQQRSFTKTTERTSPWIGPLARADPTPTHHRRSFQLGRRSSGNDSDSDGSYDEHGWQDSPVVPLKPLLESLSFVPKTYGPDVSSFQTPVIPLGMAPSYHTPPASMVGSPAPSAALQLRYSTYTASAGGQGISPASPYVPGWMPLAGPGGSPAGTHPPSRASSVMGGYGTPYMRPAY